MTDTFPSDWHIQEAINRTPSHTSMTLVRVKENPAAYGYILAHARSLAEFLPEPEPVDPYVEAAAQLFEAWDEDNGVMIQSALLAVRMARGEA